MEGPVIRLFYSDLNKWKLKKSVGPYDVRILCGLYKYDKSTNRW